MLNKKYYTIAGIIFILLFFLNAYVHVQADNYEQILWLCSFTTLLLAIGLLTRNNLILSSTLAVSLVLQTIWVIDVTSLLIFGRFVTGTAGYLTTATSVRFFLTFYHVFLWIVPVFAILDTQKFHKYSWIGASVFFFIVSLITLSLTELNVNCVRQSCIFGFYEFLRPITGTLSSFLPSFVINWLILTLIVFIPTHLIFRAIVKRMN